MTQTLAPAATFATRLTAWQRTHGRHDLPWQNTRDPYRIWLSEIMLQQTQVGTVRGYYARFLERLPTVAALADATDDEVMALWAGLGYYSRARNLHQAAKRVLSEHKGQFPATVEALARLPGIGRSTAAAIAAFAFDVRAPILDGNVKRVLARHAGIEGFPGTSAVERVLWQAAAKRLPDSTQDMVAYTQGLMDLGATICARTDPRCLLCPVATDCVARDQGRTAEIPASRPGKLIPQRAQRYLLLTHARQVLLVKRPPSGIWGGLWCLPELADSEDAQSVARLRFGVLSEDAAPIAMPALDHGFTHFKLRLHPIAITATRIEPRAAEAAATCWLGFDQLPGAALPAPIARLLRQL